MAYLGDFQLETTFDFKFTTVDNTGLPVTLASGEVVVYEDNGTAEITGAETLTLDFDGITGLHNCRIAATDGNGFAVGSEYQVVVSVGTIDSVSAVGYVVGSFSIENRAALMPTVNGTRLDVTATGAAGIDWANIEGQGTTVDLSATDIQLADTTTTVTNDVGITQAAADKVFGSSGATLAELSQAIPPATPRPDQAIMLLYMALRNKLDTTSTLLEVHNDAGTVIAQAALSDDGTTFTRAEMVAGV